MANCNTHIFVIEGKLILCFEKTHTLNKTVERKFSEIYFSKRLIFLLTKSLLRYKNVFFQPTIHIPIQTNCVLFCLTCYIIHIRHRLALLSD